MKPRSQQHADSELIATVCLLGLLACLSVAIACDAALAWPYRVGGAWAVGSLPVAVVVGAWLRWCGRYDRG